MQKINPGFQTRFRFLNPAFEIYPENKMTFFGKKVPVRLIFKANDTHQITGLEGEIRGQQHQFLKH